ncbi:hypothetical protein LINGRAHAP2_LOCUS32292 [Linum grandiflorum]
MMRWKIKLQTSGWRNRCLIPIPT